jgi:hypothetical protein
VRVKGKVPNDDDDVSKSNIGTEEDPKFVKLSSNPLREQRDAYTKLLREFVDVFT